MDLVFEIGCEELPASFQKLALEWLASELDKGLADARLNGEGEGRRASIAAYATPRRLAPSDNVPPQPAASSSTSTTANGAAPVCRHHHVAMEWRSNACGSWLAHEIASQQRACKDQD